MQRFRYRHWRTRGKCETWGISPLLKEDAAITRKMRRTRTSSYLQSSRNFRKWEPMLRITLLQTSNGMTFSWDSWSFQDCSPAAIGQSAEKRYSLKMTPFQNSRV